MSSFFPEISKVEYEGPDSRNPLAFKHYNRDEVIGGKAMKDHLRFAAAYWHSWCNGCADPFGAPTRRMPWQSDDPMAEARNKVRANFEFCEKLGIDFYCFHDRDVAPEAATLKESEQQLDEIVKILKEEQDRTGIKLLWGTANCFSHPRYMHGASTSCNADAFAFASAQVAKAMDVTRSLGGAGYVFWGGREGYKSLLNTDLKRELDHLALFLQMAVDHKKAIGFEGQLYIEPKPKEPTKHQYDFDSATVIGFLKTHGLADHYKLNVEANHATLAGHDFQHDLEVAAINGMLGSVDANRGDLVLGWDTDQFPTDIYECTKAMITILRSGGFTTGGLNFDAHVQRESIDPADLAHAHIGAMDAFARGLRIAAGIADDGWLEDFKKARYSSWDSGIGAEIEAGKKTMADLREYMLEKGEAGENESGGVELLENLLNECIR